MTRLALALLLAAFPAMAADVELPAFVQRMNADQRMAYFATTRARECEAQSNELITQIRELRRKVDVLRNRYGEAS